MESALKFATLFVVIMLLSFSFVECSKVSFINEKEMTAFLDDNDWICDICYNKKVFFTELILSAPIY